MRLKLSRSRSKKREARLNLSKFHSSSRQKALAERPGFLFWVPLRLGIIGRSPVIQWIHMDALEKIFGGAGRVKIMRLFLFNETLYFETSDVCERSKVDAPRARRELNFLAKTGLIKKSTRGSKTVWYLNDRFAYLKEFQQLLLQTSLVNTSAIVRKISKIGRLKLVIFTGLFKEQLEGSLDILIVAEKAKKSTADSAMANIEAEIGKEIRFAVLDLEDFKYRLGVGDRLIRDVLDYPHEVVYDKIGLSR